MQPLPFPGCECLDEACSPRPGLRAPLQPVSPSPPAPKPGPPQGRLGQGPRGHSQAGQHVLLGPAAHKPAACPCLCCPWRLSSLLATAACLLGRREAQSGGAAWAEQAVGLGRVSPGQPAGPVGPAGPFPLEHEGSARVPALRKGAEPREPPAAELRARLPSRALPWHLSPSAQGSA